MRYRSIELVDNRGHRCNLTLLSLGILIDPLDDMGTLSLLVDETALRLYEDKVRSSEHSLRLALDNARMGFWDENLINGKATSDANWFHLLGLDYDATADPLLLWEERLHPDDRARLNREYELYLQHGEGTLRTDYRIQTAEKGYIWVQDCVCVTEYTEDGQPKRLMGTMQDISERKQTESELELARDRAESANEAKSQFIATISHEIRTPLNAIIGMSSFLSEGELEEEKKDLAETIYASGKSLLVLVNDILDFSKIEAGHLDLEVQEYPLRLFFEDCIKLFRLRAAEKNVRMELDIEPSVPEYAIGDMERLRQIVQNLLANALKFTDAGEVKISVRRMPVEELPEGRRPDPLEPIGYLDQPDHEYLQVLVCDTGIGIPSDRQHVLFEAFSQVDAADTRKHGGTGLGLVICKRLVHAMGGRIWLDSDEGEGAVFGFVIRTKASGESDELANLTRTPFDPVDRIAEQHPCDIMIVGEDEAVRPLVVSCRKLGYTPHRAKDYNLSLQTFGRRRYNIIFIWMDEMKKPLELARSICAQNPIKKPDAIVGFADASLDVSIERCRLSGMEVLVKEEPRPQLVRELILDVLEHSTG